MTRSRELYDEATQYLDMENTTDTPLRPFETPLAGDVEATGGCTFGYDWFKRTFGLGAIKVEWTTDGLRSIEVWARPSAKEKYMSKRFASTKTCHWFRLMNGEYITEIDVGVASNRIGSVRFHTNLRASQWFGAKAETVHHLSSPPGYFIHMIHGRCGDGTCKNVGAFVVPLTLRVDPPSGCVRVSDSAQIGAAATDRDSSDWFNMKPAHVRAIVVRMDLRPTRIFMLRSCDYSLHLASRDASLDDGDCLLVLVEGELLTGLRVWVGEDEAIASVQFVTTRRTTLWFGSIPPADAVIETRSIEDEPQATHIGGVYGMHGENCIKAIQVAYYRRTE